MVQAKFDAGTQRSRIRRLHSPAFIKAVIPANPIEVSAAWPKGEMHSTDLGWLPNNHENRLLDFVATLIVDVAASHPAVTQQDVAGYIASAVVGRRARKVSHR
jgi:hypothetical protein